MNNKAMEYLKKEKYDYFLIWGNGIPYKEVYREVNDHRYWPAPQKMFSTELVTLYPHVRSVISEEIVDLIFQRLGYFFDWPFPEYVAFPMALLMTRDYIFLDKPLAVRGRTPDSLGPRTLFNLYPTWSEQGDIHVLSLIV